MTTVTDGLARGLAWERRTGTPLAVLGLLFLAAYSVYVLVPGAPAGVSVVIAVIALVTWAAFFIDMVVRVALTPAGRRLRYLFAHPVEVLSIFVPVFRALRVVGLLRFVPLLRGGSGSAVRGSVIAHALLYAVIYIYVIALATLQVERDAPEATITSFGDAIWWAFVTIATVGYGDTYPVTSTGRVLAIMLMAGGIVIVGTTSAIVVSYIAERISAVRAAAAVEPQGPSSESSAS